jgi:hypothetical protein
MRPAAGCNQTHNGLTAAWNGGRRGRTHLVALLPIASSLDSESGLHARMFGRRKRRRIAARSSIDSLLSTQHPTSALRRSRGKAPARHCGRLCARASGSRGCTMPSAAARPRRRTAQHIERRAERALLPIARDEEAAGPPLMRPRQLGRESANDLSTLFAGATSRRRRTAQSRRCSSVLEAGSR